MRKSILSGSRLSALVGCLFAMLPAAAPAGSDRPRPERALEVLCDAMTGMHEARPHGVGDSVDWAKRPRIGAANTMPPGWNAFIAWGQVYAAADGNPATNARVHIREMQAFMLRKSTHTWTALHSSTVIEGAAYREDFAGDENKPADLRQEPDGAVSVLLSPGSNFHFWPKGARAILDPADLGGLAVVFRARLVRDRRDRGEDRRRARILAGAGGDYWQSPTAAWDQWKTNADVAIGKFRFVTSDWRWFAAHTLSADALRANPPPVP